MVVVPAATELATPRASIAATLAFDEVQFTWLVRFCVLPSLKLPVAANCTELPRLTLGMLGVTVMEVRVALVTFSDAVPTCPANSAVIVAVPGAMPDASPWLPGATLTVATDDGDAVQMAEFVRFCVFPSANVPMALKCTLVCSAMVALPGVICTDVSTDGSTTKPAVPLTEPCCAVMVAVPSDCPVA